MNHNTCKDVALRTFEFEEALGHMKAGGWVRRLGDDDAVGFFIAYTQDLINSGRFELSEEVRSTIPAWPKVFRLNRHGVVDNVVFSNSQILRDLWTFSEEPDSWGWALEQIRKGKTVTCSRLGPSAVAYLVKYPTQFDHKHSTTNVSLGVSRLLNAEKFEPFVVVESVMGIRLPTVEEKKYKDWRVCV